jgi:hypothetical protein
MRTAAPHLGVLALFSEAGLAAPHVSPPLFADARAGGSRWPGYFEKSIPNTVAM